MNQHAQRIAGLDGIRGIAILLVIGIHMGLLPGGGSGVTVFFVLSGYLITRILSRPGGLSRAALRRFYLRRLLRLYPALIAVCAFCLGFALLFLTGSARHHLLMEVAASVTYTSDFYLAFGDPTAFGYLGHTWSLAIEEQFYLCWPLILLALSARGGTGRHRALFALAMAAVVCAWRAHLVGRGLDGYVGVALDTHADQLLIGCALALGLTDVSTALASRPLTVEVLVIAAIGGLVAVSVLDIAVPDGFEYLIVALCSAILIYAVLTEAPPRLTRNVVKLLSWPVLTWFGRISYSLYLWHVVILDIAKDNLGVVSAEQKILTAPLLAVTIFGVSYLSYRWIEQPFQHLKDRKLVVRGDNAPDVFRPSQPSDAVS